MSQWFPIWDRQFDDEPGGGFADEAAGAYWSGVTGLYTRKGGQAYDEIAGLGDWFAGDVDEAIGRQFDDEPGGGFLDVGPLLPTRFVPVDFRNSPSDDSERSAMGLVVGLFVAAVLVLWGVRK